MKIKNFSHAQQFLYQQIPRNIGKIYSGSWGLEKVKYFLSLLDDPQDKLKVIHIAGTSGKGSTAYLTSLMLKSLGFRVGLLTSPHITDMRERIQINHRILSKKLFVHYLNEVMPCLEQLQNTQKQTLTYFELFTPFAYHVFAKERVDYAVIETGFGGLLDATNTVSRQDKIAVITKIGLDHMKILGKTISAIAAQKAGIIQKNNMVISTRQNPKAAKIIRNKAREKNAQLIFVEEKKQFKNIIVNEQYTQFDFAIDDTNIKQIKLSLLGSHQAENCSLALTTFVYLSKRDGFMFHASKIGRILVHARFDGRLEQFIIGEKKVIVDGAHNPQKMKALANAFNQIFPKKKFHFLLAFKHGKQSTHMLSYILPLAEKITVTSFFVTNQELLHVSEKLHTITDTLDQSGFTNYQVIADPKEALGFILNESCDEDIVITGSLYLIGEIYTLLKKLQRTKRIREETFAQNSLHARKTYA